MNATPPAKKDESPPDDVEAGYAKKAEAARGKKKMSEKYRRSLSVSHM